MYEEDGAISKYLKGGMREKRRERERKGGFLNLGFWGSQFSGEVSTRKRSHSVGSDHGSGIFFWRLSESNAK